MNPVPIGLARWLGRERDLDGVVIIALDCGENAITSYGRDWERCQALKRWIDEELGPFVDREKPDL